MQRIVPKPIRKTETKPADALYDDISIHLPTGLDFKPRETVRILLRAVLKLGRVDVAYPISTQEALSLLRLCGYDPTRPNLSYVLNQKYLPRPRKVGHDYAWGEQDLVNFGDALERMRRWAPLHPSHIHKMADSEKFKMRVQIEQKRAAMKALAEMPLRELIGTLVRFEEQDDREMAAFALLVRLGEETPNGN